MISLFKKNSALVFSIDPEIEFLSTAMEVNCSVDFLIIVVELAEIVVATAINNWLVGFLCCFV